MNKTLKAIASVILSIWAIFWVGTLLLIPVAHDANPNRVLLVSVVVLAVAFVSIVVWIVSTRERSK